MDQQAIENRFTFHPASPQQTGFYERLREGGLKLATLINELCPDSHAKAGAVGAVDQAVIMAIASIARHSPPAAADVDQAAEVHPDVPIQPGQVWSDRDGDPWRVGSDRTLVFRGDRGCWREINDLWGPLTLIRDEHGVDHQAGPAGRLVLSEESGGTGRVLWSRTIR